MGNHLYKIAQGQEAIRLDLFLSKNIKDISRSKLKKAIEDGAILLNGKKAKASTILRRADEVLVPEDLSEYKDTVLKAKPQNLKLDIVYEDDDLLVVYKKRGVVVHPASGNVDGTLVNALVYYLGDNLSKVNGPARPGIVHRIDKDTSGLLLVAKNDRTHLCLAHQLKEHSIKREYNLICHGQITNKTVIDQSLARDEKNRLKYAVNVKGKCAYTTIEPIEIFDKYTYAKAILKTGRTHQIRVHLRHINRPIVGDTVYSNYKETIKGQLLHAGVIGFVHPRTKKYMEFNIKEPKIFLDFLKELRKGKR